MDSSTLCSSRDKRSNSACDSGLALQPGYPTTVASFNSPVCPVSGLDRCNDGNTLASASTAADETDPHHLYVAWASSSKPQQNEDIMVSDSTDSGMTFRPAIRANTAVRARRFMPWIVSDGGKAYVNWYDRRFATTHANNDVTHYFGAIISLVNSTLAASGETDISQTSDPQCGNLWPEAPRSELDATTCPTPQAAGVCFGTQDHCDYKRGCTGGRQCLLGEGLPKFGDYNGFAVRNGKRYSVWSSSTPPSGTSGPKDLALYLVIDEM